MTVGRSQRAKGAAGEREACHWLSERLGTVVRRQIGQARDGGTDIHLGPFRVEVKRRRGIAVHEWVDQATAACAGQTPVVMCRADGREWLVVMRAEDAIRLIQGELIGRE